MTDITTEVFFDSKTEFNDLIETLLEITKTTTWAVPEEARKFAIVRTKLEEAALWFNDIKVSEVE